MQKSYKTILQFIFIILIIAFFTGFSANAGNLLSSNDKSNRIVKKGDMFLSQEAETIITKNSENDKKIENSFSYNTVNIEENIITENDMLAEYSYDVEDLRKNYNDDDIFMTFKVDIDGISYDLEFILKKDLSNNISLRLLNGNTSDKKYVDFNNEHFESRYYYVQKDQKQVVIKISESCLKIGDSTETNDQNIISDFYKISDINMVNHTQYTENEISQKDDHLKVSHGDSTKSKLSNRTAKMSKENVASNHSKEKNKILIIILIFIPIVVVTSLFAKNNIRTIISNVLKKIKSHKSSEEDKHQKNNNKPTSNSEKGTRLLHNAEIAALKNINQTTAPPIKIVYPEVNDNIQKEKQDYQKLEIIDYISISNNYELIVDERQLPEFVLSSDTESDYILKNGNELLLNCKKYSGKYYCCYPGIKHLSKCFDIYDQYGKITVPDSQKILNIEPCLLVLENKIYKIEKKGKICIKEK